MFLTPQKIATMKAIKSEYDDLVKNPNLNIGVTIGLVDESNIFEWKASLRGPNDSSYKGGFFQLIIKFPDDYPAHAPEVVFKTPIYHVNVNPNKSNLEGAEPLGHVCISTLNWWKPVYKMKEVLANIFGLFYMANPDSPYGLDRANEYRFNRNLYEEKVRHFTKKYANPKSPQRDYNESWDFSI